MTTANQLAGLINPATGRQFSSTEPAGSVIQVVQSILTSTLSVQPSGGVYAQIHTGSITPQSTSNRILVMCTIYGQSTQNIITAQLRRNGTPIGVGDSAGSRRVANATGLYHQDGNVGGTITFSFVDSPNTVSPITYSLALANDTGVIIWVNRTASDNDGVVGSRGSTVITMLEIAA